MNEIYDWGMVERKRGQLDTFGKRERQLRIDLGMRQEDVLTALAALPDDRGVKVGQSYLSELERADYDRRPSGDVAVAPGAAVEGDHG